MLNLKRGLAATLLGAALLGLLAGCTGSAGGGSFANIPAGMGYAEGAEIYFAHLEASDAGVAEKLTAMMQSPVLLVPSLAQIPAEYLARVYVFENGVSGSGPFGSQADVFDAPPGSPGYTPLRKLMVVRWEEGAKARVLKSVQEVEDAQVAGEVQLSEPGVVINMPFITWEGGKR